MGAQRKASVQTGSKSDTNGTAEIQAGTYERDKQGQTALEGLRALGTPTGSKTDTNGTGAIRDGTEQTTKRLRKISDEHQREITDARRLLEIDYAWIEAGNLPAKTKAAFEDVVKRSHTSGWKPYGAAGRCIYTGLAATSLDHVPSLKYVEDKGPNYGGLKLLVPCELKVNLHKHTAKAECLLMIGLILATRLRKAVKRGDTKAGMLLERLNGQWLVGNPTVPCPCVQCRSVDYATRRAQLREPWALKIIETPVPR